MERTEFKAHISEQLNRNLEELFNQVLEMGGLVERQIDNAVLAVQNGDAQLAKEVLAIDKIINKEEMEIDRLCARVLARQQPTASDLRLIIIAIRIAVDLERMGDEVVKTAKLVIKMADLEMKCSSMPGYNELLELISSSKQMLLKVLNAFARLDLSGVTQVIDEEDRLDDVLRMAMEQMMVGFKAAEIEPEYLMEMVFALRASERISDHAANIAESIVYLVEGKDIRNMDSEKLNELLTSLKD